MPIEFAPPMGGIEAPTITPPQSTDPIAAARQIQELRQQQAMGPIQQQLGQQQVQGGALDLQQKQLQMQSQAGLMRAYLEGGGDPDKTAALAPKYNVLPGDLIGFQNHIAGLAKTRAETNKDMVAVDDANHDAMWQAYQPLFKEPDPAKRAAMLPGINQSLLSTTSTLKPQDLLQQVDDQHLQLAQAAYQTREQVKTQADALRQNAEAGKATAEAAKANIEQQLTQHKIDLYKTLTGTPQALEARVAASIDPTKYPDEYNRALNEAKNAPDLEGINKAIETHSQNVSHRESTIATETDPNVLKARTDQAVATERATAPIKTGTAIATAKALREGDNPAMAGVPPAMASQVLSKANSLDAEYTKAKSATDALGRILDLAEGGNKAAGSNLPLVGVETLNAINGIKRINGAEISQYGSAGSLLDQIKGKIGKIAVGQPIPQDVMNDMRELHQSLGQQSYQNYTDGLKSLNSRSGAKLGPTMDAPNIRKPEGAPPRITTKAAYDALPSGTVYTESDGKTYKKP